MEHDVMRFAKVANRVWGCQMDFDHPEVTAKPDIKWNFTKFIIDRNGEVVARFEPTADVKDIEECIKTLL